MAEPAVLEIVVVAFVIGALLFFLASSLASVVMMIHLTSLPERRRSRPQAQTSVSPSAGSAD